MQVPPFKPLVLEEDLEEVLKAHVHLFQEKTRIYAQHHKAIRLAAMKRNKELRKAASLWIEHADMAVSTGFDIVHFKAQIKHRHSIGRLDSVEALEDVLVGLRRRNQTATEALPDVSTYLQKVYDEEASKMTGNEGGLTIVSGTQDSSGGAPPHAQ